MNEEKCRISVKLIKPQAERMYMDGKEPPEILSMFPTLPSSTLYNWIKKGKWDEVRDNKIQMYTKSPEIMLQMLEQMINEVPAVLSNGEMSASAKAGVVAKVSDSISKICKSIKTLSKDQDRLGSVLFTIEELGKYMNQSDLSHLFDPEFRGKFDKLLQGFQNLMLEKYSPKNFNS
jgi:hypothetical protein